MSVLLPLLLISSGVSNQVWSREMVALENRLIKVEINMTSTVDVDKNGTFLRELGGCDHLICKSTVSYDQLQSRQKKI